MIEKKNEVITFRTEAWVKEELQKVADYNKWSLAQTANQIIINTLLNPRPEQIVIKGEDFIKAAIEIRREGIQKGVEIEIRIGEDKNKEVRKHLTFKLLESGGLGAIDDFDPIEGLTEEEILDIP